MKSHLKLKSTFETFPFSPLQISVRSLCFGVLLIFFAFSGNISRPDSKGSMAPFRSGDQGFGNRWTGLPVFQGQTRRLQRSTLQRAGGPCKSVPVANSQPNALLEDGAKCSTHSVCISS